MYLVLTFGHFINPQKNSMWRKQPSKGGDGKLLCLLNGHELGFVNYKSGSNPMKLLLW
jgi:hypothetical protein